MKTKYYLIRVEWDWLSFLPHNGVIEARRYSVKKTEALRFRSNMVEMAVEMLRGDGVSAIEVVSSNYIGKSAKVW